MSFSPLIQELIQALRCLPGVGPKSAQRMAFCLLQNEPQKAKHLSETILKALTQIQTCTQCRTLSEEAVCSLCNNPKRHSHELCIVENPADILAVEQTASYRGRYFVLRGHLSPIDGIGPEAIGIPQLVNKVRTDQVKEVILALNPTIEGQTTSYYIASALQGTQAQITRLAQGIPLGSELEYTDGGTLTHAFIDRISFSTND
jgi:recombination protein RecR